MTTPLEPVPTRTLDAAARTAPEPPHEFVEDVAGLLKRRRRRRLGAARMATAVAVVTAVVAAVAMDRAAAPPGDAGTAPVTAATMPATVVTASCTVRELPVPGQQWLAGATVDPSGRYVAGFAGDGPFRQALLWVDGQLRVLETPNAAYATGVNTAGTVVGVSEGTDGAWVYRDGQYRKLLVLPGSFPAGTSWTTAINSRGDIVGGSGGRAVIWPGDQPGHVRPVGDEGTTITGISDDGLMVGHDDGEARLWNRDGTLHLQPPGFRARLIAGAWVLGEVDTVGVVENRYALWNLTTGATVPLTVDSTVANSLLATALSESGAVLVNLTTGAESLPAILHHGRVILLPLPKGLDVEVGAISGDGRTIVGIDGARVLLWRC